MKESLGSYAKNPSNRYSLLSSWEPFENKSTTWFDPEWMFGIDNFDIVIANPPYIHLEHIKEQSGYYKYLGFKTYEARGDIYVLFYEKGIELLKTNGILCYITSNKWMRAAYGQALRKYISEKTNPIQLIDFSGQQIFDATVDTNILLLSKSNNCSNTKAVSIKDEKGLKNLSVYIKQNSVTIGFNSSNSWTILSPIEQSIKAKIEAVGTPLRNWNVKINFGIKTGCNEAFIISGSKKDELIRKDPKNAEIIRPILRGRDIKRYGYEFADQYLIVTHNGYIDNDGIEVQHIDIENYPVIKAYLNESWDIISKRTDKGVTPYNLRNCAYMDDFSKQKIVWARLMRISKKDNNEFPRFAIVDENLLVQDSLCFITGEQLDLLLAVLNSDLGVFYFFTNIVSLDEGGLQMRQQFIEQMPIPQNNSVISSEIISLLDSQKNKNDVLFRNTVNQAVYRLYGFSSDEIVFIEEFNKARFESINIR